MQIIELKQPKEIVINGKTISYNKIEEHIHNVKFSNRFRIYEIPAIEIAENIIHNAHLLPNGNIEVTDTETKVKITDNVGETLIINTWVFNNVDLRIHK